MPGDDDFLRALYTSTRVDLEVVDWSHEQRVAFCSWQWAAQRTGYRSQHPHASDSIVEMDGVPVGRLLIDESSDVTYVVDVALVPEARGRGLGTTLLEGVQATARERRQRVVLHVEGTNPARRLYARLGFTVVAEQHPYVELAWAP